MPISDILALVAVIISSFSIIVSVFAFFLTPLLVNLKSKQLEKRLEYRFELFQKIVALWEYTHNPERGEDFKSMMLKINKLVQLYGYNSEIQLFRELHSSYNDLASNIEPNKNEELKKTLEKTLNNFFKTCFDTYRKELDLEKLPD